MWIIFCTKRRAKHRLKEGTQFRAKLHSEFPAGRSFGKHGMSLMIFNPPREYGVRPVCGWFVFTAYFVSMCRFQTCIGFAHRASNKVIWNALDNYLSCYHAILLNKLPRAIGEDDDEDVAKIGALVRNARQVNDDISTFCSRPKVCVLTCYLSWFFVLCAVLSLVFKSLVVEGLFVSVEFEAGCVGWVCSVPGWLRAGGTGKCRFLLAFLVL